MAAYKGVARVEMQASSTGGTDFVLSTSNAATISDRPTWELAAGGSITLHGALREFGSFTGGEDQYEITAAVYYETTLGTLVRELGVYSTKSSFAAASWAFYATSNGLAGGTPIPGTLRLYLRVRYDAGVGGVVDADSDGTVFEDTNTLAGANEQDQGVLRAHVDSITLAHLGYPAGSQHAYGPAGDEIAAARAAYPVPPAIRGHEHLRLDIIDGAAVQVAGAEADVLAGGQTDLAVVVDETNFDAALKTYGLRATPVGAALLVPDSEPGMAWTRFVAGAGQTQVGDGVEDQTLFDADPRVTNAFIDPTPASGLANIGDAIVASMAPVSSRGDAITRVMPAVLRDSQGVIKATNATATGPNYSVGYTTVAGDDAAADTTGALWTIEVQPPGNSAVQVFGIAVSTFRVFHSTNGLPSFDADLADGVLSSAETTTSDDGGGGDRSVLNRGETCRLIGYVYRADGGYWTRPLDMRVVNDLGNDEDQQFVSPLLGRIDYTYLTANDDRATTAGRPKHARIAATDGNIPVSAPDQWTLSGTYRRTVVKVQVGDEDGDDGRLGGVFPLAAFNRDPAEQPVYIEVEVRYFRDTPLANRTITCEARDENAVAENSQSITTNASGIAAWSYNIGQGDKATPAAGKLVPALSPKHPHVYDDGNGTGRLPDWWGVTEHVWLDAHDQRAEALDKDTWNPANPTDGSENAAEEDLGYILLENEMWLSVHAMGVRLDRQLQTSGGAVTQMLKKPNGSTLVMRQTDTGADGWSPPWNVDYTAPPSENWSHEAAFAFEGNSNTVADAITVITPRTNNLVPILVAPNILEPDTALGIQLRTEKDDIAVQPDSVPRYRVLDPSTSPWAELAAGEFTSDTSGLEEAAGSEYTAAVPAAVLPALGVVVVVADAQISGSRVRVGAPVRIGRTVPASYIDFDPAGEQWLRYVA